MKNKLIEVLSRDIPVIGIEAWHKGFDKETRDLYEGVEPAESVFVLDDSTTTVYRDKNTLEEWPYEMKNWIDSHSDQVKESYNRQKNAIEYVKDKDINRVAENKPIKFIKELQDNFKEALPGLVVTNLIPLWHEKLKESPFNQEEVEKYKKWREDTEEFFSLYVSAFYEVLKEIASSQNIDRTLLKYLTFNELKEFLEKDVSFKNKAEKRRNSKYIYFRGELLPYKEAKTKLEKSGFKLSQNGPGKEKVKTISGQTANKGQDKVQGKAKVILSREQKDKFKEGDVLIAPMTTPWYVPLMKKASGIVTDEGGVTCHAAIVSREIGKPCIIGTEVATDVLEDGDLVEVDAEEGIVKILD